RRLINPLTATHVVCRTIALEAAIIGTASTAGWIIRTVTFNHVVLNQRTFCPAVKCQVSILAVAAAVITGVINYLGIITVVPALSADPVVGAVIPLRLIATAGLQCHGCTARVFPEGVIKSVVCADGI